MIITKNDARILFLEAAQDKVEFELELADLGADWAIRSKQTKAILFQSFYNRLPVVTLAEAYAEWLGEEVPF